MMAGYWKLKPGWDYKELYLTLLEQAARRRRINRFRVYTAKELKEKLRLA